MYFFSSSSKRCEELKEFQRFVDCEEEKLLKHCPTRWLSMGRCVDRLLDQFDAVVSYLSSQGDADKPRTKVANLLCILKDPLLLPWLHFIKTALMPYYQFNAKFQVLELGFTKR